MDPKDCWGMADEGCISQKNWMVKAAPAATPLHNNPCPALTA
jgi:hypothetical protein